MEKVKANEENAKYERKIVVQSDRNSQHEIKKSWAG